MLFLGENEAIQSVLTDFRIDYFEVPATDYVSANPRYTFRLEEPENLWQYFFALFDRLRPSLDLPFQLTPEGFASDEYPQLEALREASVVLTYTKTQLYKIQNANTEKIRQLTKSFNPDWNDGIHAFSARRK